MSEQAPSERQIKNERVFAIEAPPRRIWRTLLNEVRTGVESGTVTILREEPPELLELEVRISRGLAIRYRYALVRNGSNTEVAVTVNPYGLRFAVANIFSLGRGVTPYMLAVTQGLANLKASVEDGLPGDAGNG